MTLKGKNYSEIYGAWEGPIQQRTRLNTIKAKMANGTWHLPSFAGYKHTLESKQKNARTQQLKRQRAQRNEQLLSAIQIIKEETVNHPTLHDAGLEIIELLLEKIDTTANT